MMNIKGIFAVSLIAMVAMVAGAHTSNAVAAIASQGYVDQQVGSKLSSISGSTTGSGNVVTVVSASGSTVSVKKDITAEETKNKVKSVRAAASATDTAYPSEKAVATALATKANTSALSGYATTTALGVVEDKAEAAQSAASAAQTAADDAADAAAAAQSTASGKLSSISGSTTGSGNVVTVVSASGSTVSVKKDITAEETKNKVTSTNYAANVSNDTKYPTVKAVADAIADVEEKIPAAIKVDSALSPTSTNPVQNKVINTALNGKEVTSNKVTSTNYDANVSSDTKYPTVKAVADAIADVEEKIPAKITVDSALSSTSTNPVQNKVINTALSGKVTIAQGSGAVNKAVITNSSGNIITGQIASGMIADDAVTTAKLAAGAVANDNLANSAVTSAKIADGTIVNADIAADAKIATSKISGLGTLATKNAVTSAEITDGTITNADIAENAEIEASKISGLADVATSGLYGDLTGTPTIPTVNNATLTIQKNGSTVDTFTANASANKTINITVPTQTSQLTNNSGFITADDLPVATANTLGGVKSGGYITVDTSGAVTVNMAKTATNAKNAVSATNDAEGNDIISTYATKSQITALDSTSTGTGAVVTGVSQTDGKVTVTKGNVEIPYGGQDATSYVSIWVE